MFGCHLLEPVLVRRVKLIPAERESERGRGRREKRKREGRGREERIRKGEGGLVIHIYRCTHDHTARKPNPHILSSLTSLPPPALTGSPGRCLSEVAYEQSQTST